MLTLAMSEQAPDNPNGAEAVDKVMSKGPTAPTYLSTQPDPNQSWQITLAGKVIASKDHK